MKKQIVSVIAAFVMLAGAAFAEDLKQYEDAGQMICVWEKGKGDAVIPKLKAIGLDIVYRSPLQPAASCTWKKGTLTSELLEQVRSIPGIEDAEPNQKIHADEEEDTKLTQEKIDAMGWAGKLTCVWKKGEGNRDKVKDAVKAAGFEIEYASPLQPALSCKWKGALKVSQVQALMKVPEMDYIEPNYQIESVGDSKGKVVEVSFDEPKVERQNGRDVVLPNDPYLTRLSGMKRIDAPTAWASAKGSTNVVVAVVDSGVDYDHPDLKMNMWNNPDEKENGKDDDNNNIIDDIKGVDFTVLKDGGPTVDPNDENGHGTHVAGTIGAVGNNGIGVVGVNWTVHIMPLRVLGKDGSGNVLILSDAILYAVQKKATVINMSLSWTGNSADVVENAIKEAEAKNVLIVCAAGNDGKNNDTISHFPSNYPNSNIVAVAALNEKDQLADFSNFSATKVHLAAPGTNIYSTVPEFKNKDGYESFDGTSMAAPHVTGAIALLRSDPRYSSLSGTEIKSLLLKNVEKLDSLSQKCASGGVLNLAFIGPPKAPSNPVAPPDRPPAEKPVSPPPYVYQPPAYCPPVRYYCYPPRHECRHYRVRCH